MFGWLSAERAVSCLYVRTYLLYDVYKWGDPCYVVCRRFDKIVSLSEDNKFIYFILSTSIYLAVFTSLLYYQRNIRIYSSEDRLASALLVGLQLLH